MATRDEQRARQTGILELRKQRLTVRQIAEHTGYSRQHVKNVLCMGRKKHAERMALVSC